MGMATPSLAASRCSRATPSPHGDDEPVGLELAQLTVEVSRAQLPGRHEVVQPFDQAVPMARLVSEKQEDAADDQLLMAVGRDGILRWLRHVDPVFSMSRSR